MANTTTVKHTYQVMDEYVWLNTDDRDMRPVRIDVFDVVRRTFKMHGVRMPDRPPPRKRVEGYGLDPKEQKFQREVIPQKLVALEERLRARTRLKRDTVIKFETNTIDMFWEELDKNKSKYAKEIAWLQKQWHYRLFGKYFFVNGKVTYITGAHWFYLNYWYLDIVLPEYRDRDRRWFMGQQFALVDTTTFKHFDEEGWAVPNDDGEYEMIDLGRRVCMGTANPKSRRVGDTSKAQCINTEFALRTIEAHIGIQGKDDDNARMVFNHHMATPYRKLPIFWKPLSEQMDPRNEHVLNNEDPSKGLGTKIDFATSADRSAYDGYKLLRYHRDEPGKVKYEDINKAHKVVKECLTLGAGIKIIGFMMYTTTVDEMNNRGGERFLRLVNESRYYKRNKNGQTQSGMYTFFFRASDGMEGFVGPYGESVEEDPTPEQAKFIGKKIGARQHVLQNREPYKLDKDYEGLAEEKRKFPIEFRECFIPPSANAFFDMEAIERRVMELKMNPKGIWCDFAWTEGFGSRVELVNNGVGPFYMTKVFQPKETNQYTTRMGIKEPLHPDKGIIAVDPHRLEKTGGDRMSDTGIAGFWDRDIAIDPNDKDISQWESYRFILSYLYRRDTIKEMCEDVLKAAIFTGFMVYPENNIDIIGRQFIEWGYQGFLLHDTDARTGKIKPNAGWFTQTGSKQSIFNAYRDYVKMHVERERHHDILTQCLEIRGQDDMTNKDLFTAGGGCFLGLNSKQGNYMVNRSNIVDVSGVLPARRY